MMDKTMRKIFLSILLVCSLTIDAQRLDDVDEHSKYITAVDEYQPAPGQFVNELPVGTADDTPATMAEKCTKVLKNNAAKLSEGKDLEASSGNDDDYDASYLITLGNFGGYITFHFDHSIANVPGQKDFLILGNSNKSMLSTLEGGGSEPGIIMVSRDENGNGLPDDTWYELSGSADVDSIGKVVYQYEITYTRKPMEDIPWTDNQGGEGVVKRIGFHQQEYYPLWADDEMTFTGTLLPPNGIDANGLGTNWVRMFLRDGYVDNKPNGDTDANSFDIGNAVDDNRQPVQLDFIDFIRVYTGVNQFCGWMGESSTEICHAEDLHLEESITRIKKATSGMMNVPETTSHAAVYDMQGRRVSEVRQGLYIRNHKKYVFK